MSAHDDARAFPGDPVLQQRLAKYMVLQCFRNSMLEDLHAGISPSSAAGDYSDVTVSSPYGVIVPSRREPHPESTSAVHTAALRSGAVHVGRDRETTGTQTAQAPGLHRQAGYHPGLVSTAHCPQADGYDEVAFSDFTRGRFDRGQLAWWMRMRPKRPRRSGYFCFASSGCFFFTFSTFGMATFTTYGFLGFRLQKFWWCSSAG